MEGLTKREIVELLEMQGIRNASGGKITEDYVAYVKERLKIKAIGTKINEKGFVVQVFSQEDAYRIIQDFIRISKKEKIPPKEALISYKQILKEIKKKDGRTRNGKKVTSKHIYDYVRINGWKRSTTKIEKDTYIDDKKARKIINHYIRNGERFKEQTVNTINAKKIDISKIQMLEKQLEEERVDKQNAIDDRDRYRQLYENLKQTTEKKHRFLFWRW